MRIHQCAVDAQSSARLMRPGHPEGLQEAVANLYCGLADMMLARRRRPTELCGTGRDHLKTSAICDFSLAMRGRIFRHPAYPWKGAGGVMRAAVNCRDQMKSFGGPKACRKR